MPDEVEPDKAQKPWPMVKAVVDAPAEGGHSVCRRVPFVDNCGSHTAHLVRDWLGSQQRLQMYYLPKYCSHLNPVERIWFQLEGDGADTSERIPLRAICRF